MKNLIYFKGFILLVVLLTGWNVAAAYDFEEGGIYYNLNDDGTSVTVTFETTNYNSYSGNVVIPNFVTHGGTTYTVSAIGDYAFMQSPDLTGIVISDSVKTVGRWAFRSCTGLRNVTIGKSITTLRYKKGSAIFYAFQDCDSITSLTWNAVNCADNGHMGTTNIEQVTFGPDVQVIPPGIAKESLITEIIIPYSVTTIGSSAFANCHYLENVTLGNSVTTIGSSAFANCELLESIDIPDAVTSIGSSAFSGCSSLAHVTLGNSVTTIGGGAFRNCIFKFIDIPNSVTTIGDGAFDGCTSLTHVNMGNSVTSIGNGAFYDCKGIEEITIPNTVTQIGLAAFYGCDYLTKVNISSIEAWCGIQFEFYSSGSYISIDIPTGASNPLFYAHHLYLNGQEVTDLVIPESVNSVNNYAFFNDSGLTSVTFSDSVTTIGDYAFFGCTGLTNVVLGDAITTLRGHAFEGCTGLTHVTLGNSITTLWKGTFNGCINLTSLTISKSVIHIENMIENCPSLTSLSVENGNPVYDSRDNCNAIIETATNTLVVGCKSTIIPNSVTSIRGGAFYNCVGLTNIDIPNSVSTIGDYSFYGCTDLMSVTIGNSVDSIGNNAFYGCQSLSRIDIPNSVTTIGGEAFWGCTELMSAHIGNSVTSIGIWPFGFCPKLASITVESGNPVFDSRDNCNAIIETATNTLRIGCYTTVIPNTVTIIGDDSFAYCDSLTSIDIPNSITSIGSDAFWGCYTLTDIHIPNSVTSIGDYAFACCYSLKEVTVPNSVIAERNTAATGWFYICLNLERVTIGSGIAYMGVMFYYCPSITSVTCLGTIPPVYVRYQNSQTHQYVYNFDDAVYEQATLYVPIGSLETYQTQAEWSFFQNIRALGDADGDGMVGIADVTNLIDYLLSGSGNGLDRGAADVDGDGVVGIADVTELIDTLLNQ